MVIPFVYTEEEYKKLEEENRKLKAELEKEDKAKMNALNWMSDLSKFWLEQIKKLEEDRDFFKEQAILWRKDWKVAYEEKRKLEEKIEELETDYDRLKVAFEDVVSWK